MEITNADRVVFPGDGITKGDVAAYYATVAGHMLPFIRHRALSVERFPRGIGSAGFMQKNAPNHWPEDLIARHEVAKEGGGTTVYPVVDSQPAITYLANLGVITFHVPPVTIDDELHPDWAIWDLDPPPGRVDLARRAATEMRSILEEHHIPTVPLATGSKGYHLRARLEPTLTVGSIDHVARGTAALAARRFPDLMTIEFRKADRGPRVFVDWLRNSGRATAVAPWSLRPRPGAPIAVPLAWKEVDGIDPDGIRLGDVRDRLSADPWGQLQVIDPTPALDAVDRSLAAAAIDLPPFNRFR